MTPTTLAWSMASEFAPIVTFVVGTEVFGFHRALLLLIAVTVLSVGIEWMVARRIPKFGVLASATILAFGGLSFALETPFFIAFKDTLYAATFALVLGLGVVRGKPYLKPLFVDYFAMTDRGWLILSRRWMVFFVLLTIGNEIARSFLPADAWVTYKFLAVIVTWVFGFYQLTLSRRERLPESSAWGLRLAHSKTSR